MRSASTALEARRELFGAHSAHEAECAPSEAARSAEALEQQLVPRDVTSLCRPTQSIMASEYRGRMDETSARIVAI